MEGDCDGIIGDGHVGDDQAPFNSLLAMQCLNDAVFQFSMF